MEIKCSLATLLLILNQTDQPAYAAQLIEGQPQRELNLHDYPIKHRIEKNYQDRLDYKEYRAVRYDHWKHQVSGNVRYVTIDKAGVASKRVDSNFTLDADEYMGLTFHDPEVAKHLYPELEQMKAVLPNLVTEELP